MISRIKVIEKIKALLARKVENGCTEAEAMEAARKVGQLLSEHDLSMSEIDVRAEAKECQTDYFDTGKTRNNPGSIILHGVEVLFGVKTWLNTGKTVRFAFFGLPADVAGARHLSAVLFDTMEREAALYLKRWGGGRTAGHSFRLAFSSRVGERLVEMGNARKEDLARQRTTGTALVVLKDQLVKQNFSALAMKFGPARVISSAGDARAFHHGTEAGDRASLNHAVGNEAASHIAITAA